MDFDDTNQSDLDLYDKCVTCGLKSTTCVGHFGHIELTEHIGCTKLLVYKNEDEIDRIIKSTSHKERMARIREAVKKVTNTKNAANDTNNITDDLNTTNNNDMKI